MLDRIDIMIPEGDPTPVQPPVLPIGVPLRDFLAHVGTVLRTGLPAEVWIEATMLAVRAGAHGHVLELVDPAPATGSAPQLSAFLPRATLAEIRREIGLSLDPVALAGMSIVVLVAPRFDPRWHLGGRVLRLAGGVTESIRRRMVEDTVATLKRENLFGAQGRLGTPADITRIAVVHPAGAAGWDDVRAELARWDMAGLVRVRSIPTPFEGDGAAAGIAAALGTAVEPIAGSRPDLVLLVRGGGRAGLIALDTEPVPRAVCRCPVPLVTGLGHAGDTVLADRVAWRRADTPSKALAVVAEIIAGAARRADDHHRQIGLAAARVADRAEQQIATVLGVLARGSEGAVATAEAALAACWAHVRVAATALRGRLDRQAEHLDRCLTEQEQTARAAIETAGHGLVRLRTEIADRAWRALSRADAGEAVQAGITTQLHAAVERAERELERQFGAVHERAARQIEAAEAALGQIALVLDPRDIAGTLNRGFALVRDRHGRVVTDRAWAASASLLRLTFHDGEVTARPVPEQ